MASMSSEAAARKGERRASWVGYGAFAWALLFAAAHVYWAFGGNVLLEENRGQPAAILFAQNPWSYVAGWTILSLLFVFAGLFPLALVWAGGAGIGRSSAQTGVVSLGYAGMILLTLLGMATQEIGLVVFGCGVCALGVVVALIRPRGAPVAGWTVLTATWALGLAMTVYGCGYVVAALGAVGSENFVVYLVTGGASWLSGGILFTATASLAGRKRPSLTTPAPYAAESARQRGRENAKQASGATAGDESAHPDTERRES